MMNKKLKELTEDELKTVIGGNNVIVPEIEAPISPINDNPIPNFPNTTPGFNDGIFE